MTSRRIEWSARALLNGLLVAFFLFGGFGNVFASDQILADYARWGYPAWFHYLTGALELSAAGLLLFARTRLAGALLGGAVMMAAVGTVVVHGDYSHAIAAVLALAVAGLVIRQRQR